jgi:hypothetical protein
MIHLVFQRLKHLCHLYLKLVYLKMTFTWIVSEELKQKDFIPILKSKCKGLFPLRLLYIVWDLLRFEHVNSLSYCIVKAVLPKTTLELRDGVRIEVTMYNAHIESLGNDKLLMSNFTLIALCE